MGRRYTACILSKAIHGGRCQTLHVTVWTGGRIEPSCCKKNLLVPMNSDRFSGSL